MGIKEESEEFDKALFTKLKSAHPYVLENLNLDDTLDFDQESVINSVKSEYKRQGIDEEFFDRYFRELSFLISSLKEGYLKVVGYAKKYPEGLWRGNMQWGEVTLGVSEFGSKKNFLKWKNSIFLELEELVRTTKIPYSGNAAKRFLEKRGIERQNELILESHLKFKINEDLQSYMEKYFPTL